MATIGRFALSTGGRTIRNHLRREADRDNVAQEVFVKIFANLGQYAGRQPSSIGSHGSP